MTIASIADFISIVAGTMTIFGVGGLLSWSLVKKTKENLPDTTLSIFVMAFKLALCILMLWLFAVPVVLLHMFIVLSIGKGSIGSGDLFWGDEYSYAYIISYIIGVLVWVPAYFISCACIYSWSFQPVIIFFKRFSNKGS
ncbi:MAG: hypothetical protein WCJ37_06925 [Syntrophus sp. (in: bacteria)]